MKREHAVGDSSAWFKFLQATIHNLSSNRLGGRGTVDLPDQCFLTRCSRWLIPHELPFLSQIDEVNVGGRVDQRGGGDGCGAKVGSL